MKWTYGGAWERFPIREGEVWQAGGGLLAVHNLFEPLPEFMHKADLIFIDPPWNLGNLNTFYTKAERVDYQTSFDVFSDAVFMRIEEISPQICYIEIGKQNVDNFRKRLERLYPVVQAWPVTYYRKHPCWILRGSASETTADYTGMDESVVIKAVGQREKYRCIGDFVMGRGLVGLAAHAAGKEFVGTELNPRRLACLLSALAEQGVVVHKVSPLAETAQIPVGGMMKARGFGK